MPTINVNGETIHYVREGDGPPLVLVHSLGTDSSLWDKQVKHWASQFTCVAFDARGHGASTNRGGVTMADVAADIHAALDQLGLLPAHAIGISMGGLIIARLNERDPAALASAVIADSFHTLGEIGPERVAFLEDRVAGISMEDYGRVYAQEALLPATPDKERTALAAAIARVSKESYLQTARSVFTEDVSSCMQAMAVSVRVVCGDKDDRTPPALSGQIAALIPGADLVMVENAAHLANIDNPAGFHAAIDPFLSARLAAA